MRPLTPNTVLVVQLYVPPNASINRDFLRQVLKGEKSLMPIAACKFVNVPHYDELGVRHIFGKFQDDPAVMQYLMDEYLQNRYPDRDYFYTILNSVHPSYVKEMIKHANEARYAATGQAQEQRSVTVSEEWFDRLNSMPFISSK